MATLRFIIVGLGLVCGSLAVTTVVWVWMFTRPHGTFHDQGSMVITLFLFPATLVGCALLVVPSFILAVWSIWRGTAQERTIASMIILLDLFAIWYSFAIFFMPSY
ncbi:hypothetical protein ACFL6U_12760 [Planctomycetota bacterium]